MKTAAAPENAMALKSKTLFEAGKLRAKDSVPQSSMTIEAMTRTGMESRLL